MRVLGVDPGTRRTGVGILEAQGNRYALLHTEILRIADKLALAQKLCEIYQSLTALIRLHRPEILALENVFYGKDIPSMVKIGEARACAMIAASEQGIPVVEYTPARIKQSVTGNGRASKEQMQQMVKVLLNLKAPPPSDSADALAVAICHLHCKKKSHVSILDRKTG